MLSNLSNRSLLTYALIMLVAVGALNFFAVSTDLADYPYEIDYSEGFILEDTSRLISTGDLYPEPSLENGFESVKYTPVYFGVLGLLGQITGISFFTGRILNIIATLSITGVTLLFIREKGYKRNFIPLIFLAPYLTLFSSLTLRPDVLALLFSVTGLYLFEKKKLFLSAGSFVMAFLTKQVFIAGFAAVNVYLLYRMDWNRLVEQAKEIEVKEIIGENREFWRFNTAYGTGLMLSLLAIYLWNPYFLQNVLFANLGGFSFRWELMSWIYFTFTPLLGLMAYYLYIYRDRLIGTYFVFSLLLMVLQMTRGGAWIHPGLQVFLASVIGVSILYSKAGPMKRTVTAVMVLQLVIFLVAPMVSGSIFDVSSMDDKNRDADRRLLAEVSGTEGEVFIEHIGYQLEAGKTPSPEIWGVYEQQSSGNIEKDRIVGFFEDKKYDKIIAYKRLQNLPLERYIEDNYELTDRITRRDMLLNKEHWRVYTWTG